MVDGDTVAVGGPSLLRERQLEVPVELAEAPAEVARTGQLPCSSSEATDLSVRSPWKTDPPGIHRGGATSCTTTVSRVVMITGDAQSVAETVAPMNSASMKSFADVLPEDKDRSVAELQGARRFRSRWSAMVSTTPRRWHAPTSGSRSARDRCRHRIGRRHPGDDDPRGVASVSSTLERLVSQDGPEPGLGGRLQHRRHPPRGRRLALGGLHSPPAVGAIP